MRTASVERIDPRWSRTDGHIPPDGLKIAFGRGVRRIVAALARVMKGSAQAKETAAFRKFSMLVGAMVIARASDPETDRNVLAACKRRSGLVQ